MMGQGKHRINSFITYDTTTVTPNQSWQMANKELNIFIGLKE